MVVILGVYACYVMGLMDVMLGVMFEILGGYRFAAKGF